MQKEDLNTLKDFDWVPATAAWSRDVLFEALVARVRKDVEQWKSLGRQDRVIQMDVRPIVAEVERTFLPSEKHVARVNHNGSGGVDVLYITSLRQPANAVLWPVIDDDGEARVMWLDDDSRQKNLEVWQVSRRILETLLFGPYRLG